MKHHKAFLPYHNSNPNKFKRVLPVQLSARFYIPAENKTARL